jgi:hypothetical protein
MKLGFAGFSKIARQMNPYLGRTTQMARRAAPRLFAHFAGPLLAIVMLIPSLQIGPVGDDYRVIETAQPLSFHAIVRDLHRGTRAGDLYRPLEPISLRIDNVIWKGSPWGFHFTNIVLHATSAWLVSRIALLLSGSWQIAVVAGVLFALHPITAATAGQISARNAGLVCLFLLLSTWLYLKFERTNKRFLLLLSLGAFGMALLSKEQAYLFPLFLLPLAINTPDRGTSAGETNLRRTLFLMGTLFCVAVLLIMVGTEISIPVSAWEYGRYDLKLHPAQYGFVLAAFVFLVLILRLIARRYPRTRFLTWYLVTEAFIIFVGLLPSGRFAEKLEYASPPFSFSPERLAEDLSVLVSSLGLIDFSLRDALISIAHRYPWVIGSLWFGCVIVVLVPFALMKSRSKAVAGLVWLVIALSPLRVRPVEFFEMNNLYLVVPLVAIAGAVATRKLMARSLYFAMAIVATVTIFWAANFLAAQANLVIMGKFSENLHSLYEKESREVPGPLRLIANVPDPFRSAVRYPELAHWMIFRIVQSAMQLGGYSDENVAFVGERKAQILAVEDGNQCRYEASTLDGERVFLTKPAKREHDSDCISRLTFIDFTARADDSGRTWIAHRNTQYAGVSLADAEIYAFDGVSLHRLK